MKIQIDGIDLYELNETQKNVIKHDIPAEIFEQNIKERLFWVINEKYNNCFKRLKTEWEPKLTKSGVKDIPTDKDAFAELVFSQPDYKDRSIRDKEAKEKLTLK